MIVMYLLCLFLDRRHRIDDGRMLVHVSDALEVELGAHIPFVVDTELGADTIQQIIASSRWWIDTWTTMMVVMHRVDCNDRHRSWHETSVELRSDVFQYVLRRHFVHDSIDEVVKRRRDDSLERRCCFRRR